jgi:hypothetical protein
MNAALLGQLAAGLPLAAHLPPANLSTIAGFGCVRCPRCLVPEALRAADSCLDPRASFVRVHPDISGRTPGVAARSIWHCPYSDSWFTHPPLEPLDLLRLYASYSNQAGKRIALARAGSQAAYIKGILSHPAHALRPNALVVEIGCSHGYLISQFGAPDRRLLCFETSDHF